MKKKNDESLRLYIYFRELTDIGALLATFHVSPVLIDKIREL